MNKGSDKRAVISYPAGLPQLIKLSDSEFARELKLLTPNPAVWIHPL